MIMIDPNDVYSFPLRRYYKRPVYKGDEERKKKAEAIIIAKAKAKRERKMAKLIKISKHE